MDLSIRGINKAADVGSPSGISEYRILTSRFYRRPSVLRVRCRMNGLGVCLRCVHVGFDRYAQLSIHESAQLKIHGRFAVGDLSLRAIVSRRFSPDGAQAGTRVPRLRLPAT